MSIHLYLITFIYLNIMMMEETKRGKPVILNKLRECYEKKLTRDQTIVNPSPGVTPELHKRTLSTQLALNDELVKEEQKPIVPKVFTFAERGEAKEVNEDRDDEVPATNSIRAPSKMSSRRASLKAGRKDIETGRCNNFCKCF
jgi:hypothetical protein